MISCKLACPRSMLNPSLPTVRPQTSGYLIDHECPISQQVSTELFLLLHLDTGDLCSKYVHRLIVGPNKCVTHSARHICVSCFFKAENSISLVVEAKRDSMGQPGSSLPDDA